VLSFCGTRAGPWRDPHHQRHQYGTSNTHRSVLFDAFPTINSLVGVCVCESVRAVVCVSEREKCFLRGPLGDNKHFKGSIRDTEHEICLKTRGLSADPPLFSLRLARRQSKMSFSQTLFWWICSTVCLLKSTTEDLANEPEPYD